MINSDPCTTDRKLVRSDHHNNGVVHDVNNLLGAIMGIADLMLLEISESPMLHAQACTIINASKRCAGLLSSLRFATFTDDPAWQMVEVNPLIEEVIALIMLSNVSVKISESIRDTELVTINGCATELSAALMNLCFNAIDALPEGGTIQIRTLLIDAENKTALMDECSAKVAEYVQIEVADDGKGILSTHLPYIFEPYFSTKSVNNNRVRGMGLFRVRQCVVEHGGAIGVRSQPEEGTTFTLLLPIVER